MAKPIDAWWTVLLIDPLATRLVPPLSRRPWVTPTRVTVLAHLLGLVAVALFAGGWLLAGAVVFEARFVLDCVDGKLARVTGRSSTMGKLLDTVGDRVLTMATFAALGWAHAPAAVAVLVAAYPLHFHLLEMRRELLEQTSGGTPLDRMVSGGWAGALARRRLYPMPVSVDVEHLVLVVGPVAWAAGVDVLAPLLWVGAAYFVAQSARYAASMLRAAARVDRAGGSGHR